MTLTDPREAFGDQSSFISYLVGLAGLGRLVDTLATDGEHRPGSVRQADDFVHALLGLASLGQSIERMVAPVSREAHPAPKGQPPVTPITRWLR
ncbi:hypothetical protein ACQ86B_08745 [Mycolicibacterium aichiense]|uniref:hypothetical protein n=1 Tax=Mycolicibacterium aichiense TaxID=1799 RepID=UPI003D67B408